MNRTRLLAALALAISLACPSAFAAESPAPAKDWSKILYWHTPGATAPIPQAETAPEAEAAPQAATPAPQAAQQADLGREAAMDAGYAVVQQSYFTSDMVLTKRDALSGATQVAVVSQSDLAGDYAPAADEPPAGHNQDDPWEDFNRAMFQFNDTLYFWVFDPVATGYAILIPQPARVGVANVYENVIRFPIRFVNNLLQGKVEGSFRELLKFLVNTVFGLGGLVESSRDHAYLNPPRQDLGKTFKSWGIGAGNYVNWPIFGPYTIRDTFGDIGDTFAWPPTYIRPWYWSSVIWVHEKTNLLSLRLGDYEALKEASLDPYVALRDAYLQYRDRKDYDPYYDKPEDKPGKDGYVPLLRVE